ncbi:unnamed protein product [Rhodiola kirilowii]
MGRSPCCEKAHTNKGAWTKEEDDRLVAYIRANGEGCWRSLPKAAGLLRCGKSCRLRWINYLRPDLKRGNFSEEEDELIIKLHSLFGNKWSLIAGRLPGRTDNEIKNYWNTHIRRKLLNRGINPATHRSINELPSTSPDHSSNPTTTTATATAISFSAPVKNTTNQEQKKNNTGFIYNCKQENEISSIEQLCPGVNLELKISPPYQPNQLHSIKTGTAQHQQQLCFSCSLGLQSNGGCSCSIAGRSSMSSLGYDFLGLKAGVSLDFNSLEMK